MKPLYILLAAVSALSTAILWTNLPKESESPPTYGEMFRPYYHFTPPKNWMNDPNGLTFINGKYHMYYQYNPYGTVWGNMSWGHASSEDLVYWENLPVAIDMYEIPGYGEIGIFSGCNVIDVNNTSGMCDANGCLLAFYTAFSKRGQAQAMAYSNDGGMSYTQFIGNPIIDLDLQNFRDPKVFYYAPDSKWIMIVALSNAFKIQLYYSRDLIKWTYMSDFGPDSEELGIWEDPDLYELPIDDQGNTKWVLAHSIGVDAVQYYIGDFDGTTFTNTETEGVTLVYDYGFDFDEAATWNNEPQGRRLIIAWLDEGIYGGDLPTKIWRGQQTLIRQLTIRRYPEGLRVVSEPIPELQKLRDQYFQAENIEVPSNENVTLEAKGVHMEIIAEFAYPTENVPSQFGFRVLTGDNQTTLVGYDTENQLLFVDRTESGLVDFDPNFHSIINTTLAPENGTIQLHIFLDSCSVEVFANNGKIAMTNLVFPDPTKDKIELFAVGGGITLTSLEAWTLKSIWDTSDTNKNYKQNEFLSLIDRVNSYIKS